MSFYEVLSLLSFSDRSQVKSSGTIHGVDSKLLDELSADNVDEQIIREELNSLSEAFNLRAVNWRQKMVSFLQQLPVEVFMMTLVILDLITILVMVVIDIYVIQAELKLVNHKGRDVLMFFNNTPRTTQEVISQSNSIDEFYEGIIQSSQNTSKTIVVENKNYLRGSDTYGIAMKIERLHTASSVLHYFSMVVMSIFVLEVVLKMIGYGKNYFKAKWEVIDGMVIFVSFGIDIAIVDKDFTGELGKTILVVFLMWRIIQILNAMVLTSRARTMFRLKVLRRSKKVADEKIRILITENNDKDMELTRLRSIARCYGADEHELQAAVVLSKTSVSSTDAGLKTMMAQLVDFNAKLISISCQNIQKSLSSEEDLSSNSVNSSLTNVQRHRRIRAATISCPHGMRRNQLSDESSKVTLLPLATNRKGSMSSLETNSSIHSSDDDSQTSIKPYRQKNRKKAINCRSQAEAKQLRRLIGCGSDSESFTSDINGSCDRIKPIETKKKRLKKHGGNGVLFRNFSEKITRSVAREYDRNFSDSETVKKDLEYLSIPKISVTYEH